MHTTEGKLAVGENANGLPWVVPVSTLARNPACFGYRVRITPHIIRAWGSS